LGSRGYLGVVLGSGVEAGTVSGSEAFAVSGFGSVNFEGAVCDSGAFVGSATGFCETGILTGGSLVGVGFS